MSEQQSAYDEIFSIIKKKLDDPSVIYTLHDKIGEAHPTLALDVASIDASLSGGFPRGKMVEIFGPEASGKTTVTLHLIAAAQRRGEMVYFIDAEHALDIPYAVRIGVDIKKLMFSQPDTGEQALETARVICEATEEMRAKHGKQVESLVVIDSVPALIPKEIWKIYEEEGMESSNALGAAARMLATKIPMICNKAAKSGVTVVFINQERDKIGVTYGSKITTPGGRTLKFFASLRARVVRVGYYDEGGQRAGIRAKLTPVKSKQFPIFNREAEFIIGPNGIDQALSMVEILIKRNVITKNGSWYKYGDKMSAQGVAKIKDAMLANPELHSELEAKLQETGGSTSEIELKPAKVVAPAAPTAEKAPIPSSSITSSIKIVGQ